MNGLLPFGRLAVLSALMVLAGTAWAEAQVRSELTADKQVRQPSGEAALVPAKDVKPGDVVVYTATYRNTGTEPAHALVATVPIPAGMEWQGSSHGDKLVPTQASLDGKAFSPIPLTRKVKVAASKEQIEPVPLSEYRFLRWNLPELSAGANVSVKLTAKVSTNP